MLTYTAKELIRIEEKFSRFNKTSYLNKLNSNLYQWQKIDAETLYLINKSLKIQNETNKYFSIFLKKDLENLGYDSQYSFKIKNYKKNYLELLKTNFQKPIKIKNNLIFLRREIEFGGLGKGYALDRISKILEKAKIVNYLINAGGDIKCDSKKNFWQIYLEHPEKKDSLIGEIKLKKGSLTSSSPKLRNWENGFHHLINPKTNKSQNEIKSIFVQSNLGIDADAYATAFFCAGFDNAIKLSKKLQIPILAISSENKIYQSENFKAKLYS